MNNTAQKTKQALIICLLLVGLSAGVFFTAGCGGSGTTGTSHAISTSAPAVSTRVSGMVLLKTVYTTLARSAGEEQTAARSAAQGVITDCGTVPDGYVAITDATVSVTGETGTTRTDSGGCFSFDIQSPGRKIFTVTKTNAKGGTTILKKAANVQAGSVVRFVEQEAITVISTVAAIVVEEKQNNGEENIDCDAIDEYIRSIETQDDVAALAAAITASADPDDDSVSDFNSIAPSTISRSVAVTEHPVIGNSTITGGTVPATGGAVSISVSIVSFDASQSVANVTATLTATGQTPVSETLSQGEGGAYAASVTLPANTTQSDVVYSLLIAITESGGTVTSYTLDDVTVSATPAVCGNSDIETGETCDDGNTTTEICTYGQTSCTVCDATCQSVAGATSYCGDSTTDTGNDEACDDGNATTETCTYGQTSCTVCNATCQSVAGATSYCGDGNTDAGNGETCDDGANNGQPNYCNSSCNGVVPSTCGNGTVEAGEDCDHSGESATCNADCTTSACGDGKTNTTAGEACDDSNTITETCTYGQTSCTVCDATCQNVAGATNYCGDNNTDAGDGEACDDGNTTTETCTYGQTSCTVCDATCQSVAGATSYCGDNTTDTGDGETCDDGNTTTETCTYGQTSCTVCDASCASVAGATSYCGDGATDGANGETCDDGASNGDPNQCNATCTGITTPVCGNTVTEAGETCDDGNTTTETCNYGQTSCTVCDATCQSVAGATNYCGDSTVDAGDGETCDDGNSTTETCTYGEESCTVCNATCQSVAGATSYCGDNTVDASNGETCDDGDTVGGDGCDATCQSEAPPSISIREHRTCAVATGGAAKCWGNNSNGALGDGGTTSSSSPVGVSGLGSGVVAISTGHYHTCAALSSGAVKCWGYNADGQLGNETNDASVEPVNVTGITNAVDVEVGESYSCALLSDGAVKCWGVNGFGNLGNNSTINSNVPVNVNNVSNATGISAGGTHTCVVLSDGGVKCWGSGNDGALGNGATDYQPEPVSVTGITTATAVSAGDEHSCALLSNGTIQCWGRNIFGGLGDDTTDSTTAPGNIVSGISDATAIASGGAFACALLSDGAVKCWGGNRFGSLGNGTTDNSLTPVPVSGITNAIAIEAGGFRVTSSVKGHACAILSDGSMECWGQNNYGCLGDGTTSNASSPVPVSGY